MNSIDVKTFKNMLDTLEKVDDDSNLFCGFHENQNTYFHTVYENYENKPVCPVIKTFLL